MLSDLFVLLDSPYLFLFDELIIPMWHTPGRFRLQLRLTSSA